jgi:hypothetical protein
MEHASAHFPSIIWPSGFSCEGEIMVIFEMLLFFVLDVRKGCILVCSQIGLELSTSEV